jgi:2-haloacid dehalogenase
VLKLDFPMMQFCDRAFVLNYDYSIPEIWSFQSVQNQGCYDYFKEDPDQFGESMKKHYPWLWFDADNTLFDYNKAETTALLKSFELFNLRFDEGYMDSYRRINQDLWNLLERQEIKPEVLRVRRFELFLEDIKLTASVEKLAAVYIEQLGLCFDLVDGAYEVLNTLHAKSKIAIVTNGLTAVQRSRLELSPIKSFITELIISEEIGAAKPHTAFFDTAFERTGNPAKSDVLIIGDSLTSDMQGGLNYGIDTCWFNPLGSPRPADLKLTYEINHLRDLLEIAD